MKKKKLIDWLSGIGDGDTKIFFWNPGGAGFFEIRGATWDDKKQERLLIILEKKPPGHTRNEKAFISRV